MCSSLPLIGKGEGVRGGGPEKTPRDSEEVPVHHKSRIVPNHPKKKPQSVNSHGFRTQDAPNLGLDVGCPNDVGDYCDCVRPGA